MRTAIACFSALLASGAAASAWAAPGDPCRLEPLVVELGPDNPHSALEVLTDPNGDGDVHAARLVLDQLLATCDPTRAFVPIEGEQFQAALGAPPTLEDSARQYMDELQVVSPFVSSVVGTGGGVPVPEELQVGLTQVVSAGQPGVMASVAGAPAPTSRNDVLAHLAVAGSALLIQPSTPDASGIPAPRFGALELQVGWNGRHTTYDWARQMADDLVKDRSFEKHAQAAAEAMVVEYAQLRAGLLGLADEARRNDELDRAARLAGSHTRQEYADNVKLHYWNDYVKPEITREQEPRFGTLALRVRYSRDVEFVPELPDLLSIGLEGSYDARFVGKSWKLGGTAHGMGSFSAYPSSICPNADADGCAARPTALIDADAGLTLTKAMANGGTTMLKVVGTFRWAPARDVTTPSGDEAELSGGFGVALEVPVGGGVALVGSYSRRWRRGLDDVSTSSFTISQAFGGPEAPKK